jgi:hypothetical protein
VVAAQSVGVAVEEYQRNAKLYLTVTLAPDGPVEGLYLHPDHRRRLRRPVVEGVHDVQ